MQTFISNYEIEARARWHAYDDANRHIAENRDLSKKWQEEAAKAHVYELPNQFHAQFVALYCQEYQRVLDTFSDGEDITEPLMPRPESVQFSWQGR